MWKYFLFMHRGMQLMKEVCLAKQSEPLQARKDEIQCVFMQMQAYILSEICHNALKCNNIILIELHVTTNKDHQILFHTSCAPLVITLLLLPLGWRPCLYLECMNFIKQALFL